MIASFSLETLLVVWIGAFLGAFAAGGAGFAFALAASAVWLHVLDPLHTTAMVVASGTLLHGILIWPIRRSIEMARLWPFIAGAAFGIPLGVALLSHTRPDITRTAIGGFLVAYGLYALTAPQLPYFGRGGRAAARWVCRRYPWRARRLFRRAADHLDADTRLAERGGAR